MIILFLIIILLILIYLNFDKIKTLFFKNKNFIFKILFSFLIFSGLFFLVSFLIKFFPNLKLDDKFLKIFADTNNEKFEFFKNPSSNFTALKKSDLNNEQNFNKIIEKKDLSQIEKEEKRLEKLFSNNILEKNELIKNEIIKLKKYNLSSLEVEKILEDNFVTKEDLERCVLSLILEQIISGLTYELALQKQAEQGIYIQENDELLRRGAPEFLYKAYFDIMDENNLFDLTEIIPYKTSYFVLLLELKRRREVLNIQDQSIEILDKVADDQAKRQEEKKKKKKK